MTIQEGQTILYKASDAIHVTIDGTDYYTLFEEKVYLVK
jgi:co-chaperonin GroES (HSP10)